MGRKPSDDKKVNINFRIRSSLVEKLRSFGSYNSLVEKLIEEHFLKNQKGNNDEKR